MGWTFALACRDPNLVGCVLHALDAQRPLAPPGGPSSYGLGYYVAGEPLLERQPNPREPMQVKALAQDIESELLIAAAGAPERFTIDENTQPFRFRRWLFAHAGEVPDFAQALPALLRGLPELLRGQRKGDGASEVVFLHVLARLRQLNALDEPVSPAVMGRALREGLVGLETVLRDAGVTRPASLRCVLSDGRSLAVSRVGGPCSSRFLEGLVPCARCGIDEKTQEMHPALRPHRRLRAVAFVSEDGVPGFTALPERSVVTVSNQLDVKTEGF